MLSGSGEFNHWAFLRGIHLNKRLDIRDGQLQSGKILSREIGDSHEQVSLLDNRVLSGPPHQNDDFKLLCYWQKVLSV